MENELGSKLKALREAISLSAKDVAEKLKDSGYEVSDKTIYGYEYGKRMPNADIFMALCEIYHCNNILETFKNIQVDYSIPDDKEWELIEKYRSLDSYGAELVDTVVEAEYQRCKDQEEHSVKLSMEDIQKLPLEQRMKLEPYLDDGLMVARRKK